MKRVRSCWLVLMVVLVLGCLEKPAPWVPPGDGVLGDGGSDGEMLVGDGVVAGDLADVMAEAGLPGVDADAGLADHADWDVWSEVGETVAGDGLADADVPTVTPGAPVLLPGIFSGWSAGGKFTLRPVGPGGPADGMMMSGGKWTLSACRGGK